ncbi:MAG: hypothetical protein KDA32_10720 [Phycisphaerales bacterium]|nr:hypothetical protein [Phycisphaerales bacterium]
MAKNLRQLPPSSSVVRLLDPEAAARAVAPAPAPSAVAPADAASASTLPTVRIVKRELALCSETDATFEQLIQALRRASGTRLSASHVLRAVLRALAPHLRSIELETLRTGPRRMPGNAAGTAMQRHAFEAQLAECIAAGVRANSTLR